MKNIVGIIAIALCFAIGAVYPVDSYAARPVYIFAHRVNDVPPYNDNDIQEAIDHGANAIEFDLQSCDTASGWKVHHNQCDGWGARTLDQWLAAYVRTFNRSKIRAIAFDIKAPPKAVTGEKMRRLVSRARVSIPDDVLIIYGVGSWTNRTNLIPILQGLRGNEAVTIDHIASSDGDAKDVINFFRRHGVVNQVYADGISALAPTPSSVWKNTEIGRQNRDSTNEVKLVYSWTYEDEATIEEVLIERGMDGILVNDCAIFCVDHFSVDDGLENALEVIWHRPEIRVATAADLDFWGFYSLQPAVQSVVVF